MLPSISPPAENDFRNKAGKWNLYSMSSLNKPSLKLQNTLYGRIWLIQIGKKSRSHNSLKNLWSGMPVWSWLETEKNEQQFTDLEKEENSTETHFFIFSISTLRTDITTEWEQGGITGRHNNSHSCFRSWTMEGSCLHFAKSCSFHCPHPWQRPSLL